MKAPFLACGVAAAFSLAGPLAGEEPKPSGLALQGAEAEEFLRTARFVEKEAG